MRRKWPGYLLSAALSLPVTACEPTLEDTLRELAKERELSDQRAAACEAGEPASCTALHLACLEENDRPSCGHLSRVAPEVLAANAAVFDDPLHYTVFSCLEMHYKYACEELRTSRRASKISLGLSEEAMKAASERLKSAPPALKPKLSAAEKADRKASANKLFGGAESAGLLEGLGGEGLGEEGFGGEGLRGGVFDDLHLTDETKRLCDSGDADACYTFAHRQGSLLNSTPCCFGCGEAYDEVHAAMRRSHDLFQEACRGDDRVACFKMGKWRDERVYGLRREGVPKDREELRHQNEGFHRSCALGLLDGCNASVRNIDAFNRRALVHYFDWIEEELHEDSGRACSLAKDPTSGECMSYLVLLVLDTPAGERDTSIARRAKALGMEDYYGQLAYWAQGAYGRRSAD